MLRGTPRILALILVAALALAGPACKTVQPPASTAPTQPRAFPSDGKAERVDETTGFGDKPTAETFSESSSGLADTLNARGLLKPVYFDFDSADLRQDGRDTLTKNAAAIKGNGGALAVRIEGHCDERGTVEYNLALGDRRARAAREALVSMGVSGSKLRTISYGKERPADPGHSESAWAMNRRAEFVFIAE